MFQNPITLPIRCHWFNSCGDVVRVNNYNLDYSKKEEKIKWNQKLIESTNTNSDAFYWMLKREISFLRLRNIFVGATYRLTGSWLRGYCDLWEWVNRFFSVCCRCIRTPHCCLDSFTWEGFLEFSIFNETLLNSLEFWCTQTSIRMTFGQHRKVSTLQDPCLLLKLMLLLFVQVFINSAKKGFNWQVDNFEGHGSLRAQKGCKPMNSNYPQWLITTIVDL